MIKELDEWLALYREVARRNGGEPDAGRRLLSWAQAAGLTGIAPSASVWCFATPADRRFWGEMWARRILESDLARQSGQTRDDLERLAEAWLTWAGSTDGWLIIPHGEIVCRP